MESKSNPKSQAPNPNHSQLPNPKPTPKSQTNYQIPTALGFGPWELAWDLGVGSGWSLELGIWDLASVVPESHHRIDPRRPARRQEPGEHRYHDHHRGRGDDRHGVGGGQAKEQGGDEVACAERAGDADRDADRDEHHRLHEDLTHHGAALGAERHADADLVGPARD